MIQEPESEVRISDILERLLRLEALFVDPRDLQKLSEEELRELSRMPGGDLRYGRLTKLEDRVSLLEQAVVRQWISVHDCLPEFGELVLGAVVRQGVASGWQADCDRIGRTCVRRLERPVEFGCLVSHWMPLPPLLQPPQSEKQ